MHKTLLTALATATVFSAGMLATGVAAMPAAPTAAPGVATAARVREAAVVCGGNGCAPVHTKSQKRRKFKSMEYTKPL